MGMRKEGAAPAASAPATPAAAPESGTAAAIDRLKAAKPATTPATPTTPKYAGRNYNDEARGKTRCVQFEAALMSPAIAGMKFSTMEEYLALVMQAAEAGVAYTFGDDETK